MKNFSLILKVIFVYLLLTTAITAKESDYFKKGEKLFQNSEFDKSKIFFERDIVFNPKSEKSYLYLAKIFNNNENDLEEELNLNSVLLLNPKNDEALYMLTLLKIKQSNYEEAKELIGKFILVCKSFCSKENEIKNKFKKLTP
tara:strand:+ start:90 stop:518 length:429 start_codon:yes stop_codon:yes gene_type:complete